MLGRPLFYCLLFSRGLRKGIQSRWQGRSNNVTKLSFQLPYQQGLHLENSYKGRIQNHFGNHRLWSWGCKKLFISFNQPGPILFYNITHFAQFWMCSIESFDLLLYYLLCSYYRQIIKSFCTKFFSSVLFYQRWMTTSLL